MRTLSFVRPQTWIAIDVSQYNFEIMFPEMVLDTDGRCEQCRQAEKNVSKP
jgi:hypothetical protein